MPKAIARRKTKKSVVKRFKVTARGKVVAHRAGRRHLASSKNRKRMRRLGKAKVVRGEDVGHVRDSLPFA
ncbi:50S ribosomal protein L35 [Methylacidimicrobium tartarophylax]|uniref:Large ribosomal subunit protein bL35 n=1 Tax=Methylacidimicrobium tartarophylax TaxID=1041768 RepID=A0A5E6MD71_9BACT|nr:50S ribosomal protein L35 [Methylacidimicrobium tartarophylax]VVM06286.1 50S ribosomal protein L35 [Methylacidimicrobium tartarophylax]